MSRNTAQEIPVSHGGPQTVVIYPSMQKNVAQTIPMVRGGAQTVVIQPSRS